jgi:hypothetical protein
MMGKIGILALAMFFAPPCVHAARAADVPDFSGFWGRNAFDFEPTPSGPKPILSLRHRRDGTNDNDATAGDYRNPILKPEAAEAVRERGALSQTGKPFPDPSNQCSPYPPPFIFAQQLGVQLMQQKDRITMLYNQDDQVRYVRLNSTHPQHVRPSWKGDSIGHYEGDTLVIDTVGIKPGPIGFVDRYGTPHSDALHLVERYRLIDGKTAREAALRQQKVSGVIMNGGSVVLDRNDPGPDLQLQFTVEDPNTFTMPWSGIVTYRRRVGPWLEQVCAENPSVRPNEFSARESVHVPTATRADF